MRIDLTLHALQSRVNTLEKVVQLIAGTLGEPVLRQINSDRGKGPFMHRWAKR
jgi:hypothetical protein